MHRSGIILCSVDGIRRSGRQAEAATIAHRNYTSRCPAAVSVAIMGLLDRCCEQEAEWEESSGQWHFIGPSTKCTDLLNKEECWALRGVASPAPSS